MDSLLLACAVARAFAPGASAQDALPPSWPPAAAAYRLATLVREGETPVTARLARAMETR
jgi:hypothetical protein